MTSPDLFLKVLFIGLSMFCGCSAGVQLSKHWDSWIMFPARASDNEFGDTSLIYDSLPRKSSSMPVYYSAKVDSNVRKNISESASMLQSGKSVNLIVKDENLDRSLDNPMKKFSKLTKSSLYQATLQIGKMFESYFLEEPNSEDDIEKSYTKTRSKVKRKFKKFMLPLLLAYKLKFFTLIPVMLGGLTLLIGSTGLGGFFFALFIAVMSLKSDGHKS